MSVGISLRQCVTQSTDSASQDLRVLTARPGLVLRPRRYKLQATSLAVGGDCNRRPRNAALGPDLAANAGCTLDLAATGDSSARPRKAGDSDSEHGRRSVLPAGERILWADEVGIEHQVRPKVRGLAIATTDLPQAVITAHDLGARAAALGDLNP